MADHWHGMDEDYIRSVAARMLEQAVLAVHHSLSAIDRREAAAHLIGLVDLLRALGFRPTWALSGKGAPRWSLGEPKCKVPWRWAHIPDMPEPEMPDLQRVCEALGIENDLCRPWFQIASGEYPIIRDALLWRIECELQRRGWHIFSSPDGTCSRKGWWMFNMREDKETIYCGDGDRQDALLEAVCKAIDTGTMGQCDKLAEEWVRGPSPTR